MLGLLLLYFGSILLFNDVGKAGVILTSVGLFIHLLEWGHMKNQIDELRKKVEKND